jgi:hypothetical protein
MQNGYLLSLYESGLRGRPVRRIEPGDLSDPYDKSPNLWQRVGGWWSTFVDIVRETRELEERFLGRTSFRNFE